MHLAQTAFQYFKSEKRSVKAETTYNYLSYRESDFIIRRASRKDMAAERMLKFYDKFYVADYGMREAIMGANKQAIELILENIVYWELARRNCNVCIGKFNNAEI